MLSFLHTRRREAEWLDDPAVDPNQLRDSLAFIRKVNRFLGYTRIVLDHLDRFSVHWTPGSKIRLLDVGTGSADIPIAILEWADKRHLDIQIVGIDLNPQVAGIAAAAAVADPRLAIVRGDALDLPFLDHSFDYAITSMFLHHLSDEQARRALAEMGRVSRRGIIASDLLRLNRSYAAIWIATLLASPMVKHDARVSVAQAFSRPEIISLRDQADLGYAKYFDHGWHRFVLAGEKNER
ncbi:MAG TPA: methyltransferase domain-containing protein [Tepidisphaeraceae bacterium]|jgi:ubiquinone/menaquinone biosynthesis C-methylase UbiE|nr:methyltransferase domain-containing protein [Tepidisphaeraceae bacterium]